MNDSRERLSYIDYLKAFSAIMVVLYHITILYIDKSGDNSRFVGMIPSFLSLIHVPLFFICAGFLCHKKNLSAFYKGKIIRIFIPFFTFSLLKLLYSNIIAPEFSHGDNIWYQIIDAFVYGQLYWFCYAILLIFAISPLMWKKDGTKGVSPCALVLGIIAAVVTIIIQVLRLPVTRHFQWSEALFYYPFFLGGYCLKEYMIEIRDYINKSKPAMYIICSCIIIINTVLISNGTVSVYFFPMKIVTAFAMTFILMQIAVKIPINNGLLTTIGKYSLQIMFFDSFYKTILFSIASQIGLLQLWIVIPLTVLDISFSVISCMIIKKIPYVRILFGL